jgi:tetratricopeptide (TPR) repeat protein
MSLAHQNRRSGMHEDALRHYSRAVELDRAVVDGWVGQVQMLIALGEYPEAELWARKALELFRNHSELLAARAHALCRSGDLRQALAVCDTAISQPGQSAYCWMARGDIMLARKDAVESHCFDKGVQLNSDWLVLIEIAAIYVFYGRHANAMVRCRQAVEKAADQPYCWFEQGRCARTMGLTTLARQSFKNCIDLQPKHSQARVALLEMDAAGRSLTGLLRRLFRRR